MLVILPNSSFSKNDQHAHVLLITIFTKLICEIPRRIEDWQGIFKDFTKKMQFLKDLFIIHTVYERVHVRKNDQLFTQDDGRLK